jgi:NADH-quinone oxidoreductase subunit N
MSGDNANMILAILPEIGLLVLTAIVMTLDLVWHSERRRLLGWITAIGALVIIGLSVAFSRPVDGPTLIWGGMLRLDDSTFVFRMIFLAGAALTALFASESENLSHHGEFYALMLVSTLGMVLMASASDLIMLYLAIETTSIPLYVMAGFFTHDQKSVEAGLKYILFGAMTSAVMLYGFTLLFGFTGTTQIYQLAGLLGKVPLFAQVMAITLVLVGFGFKISAVPFHFWAPDVYEGSPSPVAGFLSTTSKAAGFAVLLRVMIAVFPPQATSPSPSQVFTVIIATLAVVSMFVGNLLALAQRNIKRLLAYSSIAQAGYILVGVAANSALGTSSAVYYLMAYLVTNLAAFGIVTIVGKTVGSDELSAYAGLSRRSPGLAMALLVCMLSLGGIPPFAGFFAKVWVFGAAVQSGLVWLALLGFINSMIALYYYLIVLKVIYLQHSVYDDQPVGMPVTWKVALIVCMVGVIALGTIIWPWYGAASSAAASLF